MTNLPLVDIWVASMETYIQVFCMDMFSLGQIPRSGIVGSYGECRFNIFKKLPNCSLKCASFPLTMSNNPVSSQFHFIWFYLFFPFQ